MDEFIVFSESITEAWNKLLEVMERFVKAIKSIFKVYLEKLMRYSLSKSQKYYLSIVLNKSNNWRKMHNIPMTRMRQKVC
jgi:hypothetical protein